MLIYIFLIALANLAGGRIIGGRIIGGDEVLITEFPHQVALYRRQFKLDRFQCGGVIVSPKYVLTAAHCKKGPTEEYKVLIGESEVPDYDKLYLKHRKSYRIKEYVLHPDFDKDSAPMYDNDIAILIIDGKLELDGTFAKAIQFVLEPTPPGTIVEVTGYGNTERLIAPRPRIGGSSTSLRPLKAAYVPTVEHSSCVKYFKEHHPNYHVTENMICAGRPCQEDACQGDSGGPLINDEGKLVGLVSYGKGCGSFDPGVYTSILKYKDFIYNKTDGLLGF